MSEPLISIIIPVLNGIHFLDRCFITLKEQNYSNLEIIFVDNSSSDGSREIINQHCSEHENYYLFDCVQMGPGVARNKGIENARGEYISFLDVDDEIDPDKHVILLGVLKKYPEAAMAVGKTRKMFSNDKQLIMTQEPLKVGLNKPPATGLLWLRQFQCNPTSCSYLLKKSAILETENVFADIPYGEDIAFNVLVGLSHNIVVTDKLVCTYHRHSKSSVSIANQQMESLERYFQFYEKFALPFFYEKRDKEPFKHAYKISERIAFKILMKLMFHHKKQYHESYSELNKNNLLSDHYYFYRLFSLLPYKYVSYLFDIFHSVLSKKS